MFLARRIGHGGAHSRSGRAAGGRRPEKRLLASIKVNQNLILVVELEANIDDSL